MAPIVSRSRSKPPDYFFVATWFHPFASAKGFRTCKANKNSPLGAHLFHLVTGFEVRLQWTVGLGCTNLQTAV